jgi:hypothetical protein
VQVDPENNQLETSWFTGHEKNESHILQLKSLAKIEACKST